MLFAEPPNQGSGAYRQSQPRLPEVWLPLDRCLKQGRRDWRQHYWRSMSSGLVEWNQIPFLGSTQPCSCRYRHCQLFGYWFAVVASVLSNSYVSGITQYRLGDRRMSLSRWVEGSDSDHVTGLKRDIWLVGHCKIPAWQRAKLRAMGVRGRLRFDRSLPRRDYVSLRAQGLSGEAMKGNPTTTVIPQSR